MPSGLYERTPRILENVRKAHRLLWETRGIEIAQKISIANKGRSPWNKKPELVCEGCGRLFPYRYSPYRITGSKYCSRGCYLNTNNPSKSLEVLRKISETLKRSDINPAKRLEVRRLISSKLKGRDAWWMKGDNNSAKKLDVREKIAIQATKRWRNKEWAREMLIACRGGGAFGVSVESKHHHKMKLDCVRYLDARGYDIEVEKPICVNHKWYIVDVVGVLGSQNIAIECGDCKEKKLEALGRIFDKVIHIPYGNKFMEVLNNV